MGALRQVHKTLYMNSAVEIATMPDPTVEMWFSSPKSSDSR